MDCGGAVGFGAVGSDIGRNSGVGIGAVGTGAAAEATRDMVDAAASSDGTSRPLSHVRLASSS